MTPTRIGAMAALCIASACAFGEESVTELPAVQVTATREPEPVATLPASVTIISGEELRTRGASDLRTALSLVAGVEGTPTGDAGPASSVPALWGLREADSFLLVIDGVPAGGVFNPATVTVDLTGVERIEVLRGAAPVMYGATSFNGVIHVIHYAAGQSPAVLGAGGGSHGSYGASWFGSLPAVGDYRQSLSANVERRGFSVDRQDYDRYHLLYRGATGDAERGFHLDADVAIVPQSPGSTTFRDGGALRTDLVHDDANHNPSDAKMNQDRYHLAAGLRRGEWSATLALTQTKDEIVRGFHAGPNESATSAHGYEQEREITDVYFDTHFSHRPAQALELTYGLDYLFGRGKQEAFRFPYSVGLDGAGAQDSAGAKASCVPSNPDECVALETEDERNFAGLYAQADWSLAPSFDVLAGLRLNHTQEKQAGENDTTVPPTAASDEKTRTRLSGMLGASWSAWRSGNDALTVYADYRNTYKPLAYDFGPEGAVGILSPETSDSYELGVKGNLGDGRLHYDASLFRLDFRNQKTLDASGNAVNAGQTRFQGGEIEARYALFGALAAAASYAYHDPRFVHFNRDGTPGGVVDGKRFELSPYHQAGLGLIYAPPLGLNATLLASYTGERMLTKSNSLSAGGFTVFDATLGWQFRRLGLQLSGQNLADRRDPVAESELSEDVANGTSSYYLMPGRRVTLSASLPL